MMSLSKVCGVKSDESVCVRYIESSKMSLFVPGMLS